MTETTSPVNDYQRDLDVHNNPCEFHEDLLIRWTINTISESLCFAILNLSEIRSLSITILCSISFLISSVYSIRDFVFSCWPALNTISPSGPSEYLSVTRINKSRSWFILLNPSLRNICIISLWSPFHSVTFDINKITSEDDDYV